VNGKIVLKNQNLRCKIERNLQKLTKKDEQRILLKIIETDDSEEIFLEGKS
jgi:hypothetical protein